MARIWTFSDLHVDFAPYNLPDSRPDNDVIVIAGDVGERLCNRVVPWLEARFAGVPVVYVPGNHDMWHGRLPRELETARVMASHIPGLHVLAEGETAVIWDARFVGATLWTDYRLDPLGAEIGALAAGGNGGLRDHKMIQATDERGMPCRWRPQHARRAHERHRAEIVTAIARPFDGPTVVVTHHAPHPLSLRQGRYADPLDPAYASDLSAIMEGPHAPALWIHGHVHASRDYLVGRTRVVCNPRGYVSHSLRSQSGSSRITAENPSFDPSLVLEV